MNHKLNRLIQKDITHAKKYFTDAYHMRLNVEASIVWQADYLCSQGHYTYIAKDCLLEWSWSSTEEQPYSGHVVIPRHGILASKLGNTPNPYCNEP